MDNLWHQQQADAIAILLSNKGYTQTGCEIVYSSHSSVRVRIEYKDIADVWQFNTERADDVVEAIAKTRWYVNNLPTAYDARQQAFRLQIVKLLETGRELGVGVDFLNPLEAMAKKLTENVIEHKKETW